VGLRRCVVAGGGFFGVTAAIYLAERGHDVTLVERGDGLLTRASYVNQARVHGGYHYPRSILTALRSRVNLTMFAVDFADCIDAEWDNYYAIGRSLSKVSARQFRQFADRIGAPLEPVPDCVRDLFDPARVEAVFRVREFAFDAVKVRERVSRRLTTAGVRVLLGSEVRRICAAPNSLVVEIERGGATEELPAEQVLNCTYSRINQINRASQLPAIPLKHEIAEIALIEPPDQLRRAGVTVMCGPFFSTMPFPPRQLHSFTHVRYTPHTEWNESAESGGDPYEYLESARLTSAYPRMLADAARYLPVMRGSHYVESLYEVKTLLPQSEVDDSRPILYRADHGLKSYICILGGKFDNVYDVLEDLA
jgi:glycine/D-amino acid oxidase-like deaminating enzyme